MGCATGYNPETWRARWRRDFLADGLGADLVLARYNAEGSLRTTFSGDGEASPGFGALDSTFGVAYPEPRQERGFGDGE